MTTAPHNEYQLESKPGCAGPTQSARRRALRASSMTGGSRPAATAAIATAVACSSLLLAVAPANASRLLGDSGNADSAAFANLHVRPADVQRPRDLANGHRFVRHAKPARSGLQLGVNINWGATEAEERATLATARSLHASLVRVEVRWSQLEPQAGRISPEALASLNALFNAASADNVKVLVLTEGTPCWDSSAPTEIEMRCVPGEYSIANRWPPNDNSLFGKFAAFLAKRYGRSLAGIEIWNEPDQANEDYLAGAAKAEHYAAILKASYSAIKAVAPTVPVLAGSFVGPNGVFLKLLYKFGIAGHYDGLSVHYYTLTLADLRAINEVQRQNGDHHPLWLMEFGWSSCWPKERIQEEQGCVTAAIQARNLASITHSIARIPYVAAEVFYKLNDAPAEEFGVLTAAGKHKPSFNAVRRAFANPLAPPDPIRLHLKRRGQHVIATGSGPVGDYLQLEALRRGHIRYRATFALDRFNRFRLRLPASVSGSPIEVRVHEYASPPNSGTSGRI